MLKLVGPGRRPSPRRGAALSVPGTVTVAGKPSDHLALATSGGIVKKAGLDERASMEQAMEYAIVIEQDTPRNFSAFAPNLPRCVAAGATRDGVTAEMRAAIAFHIESLRAPSTHSLSAGTHELSPHGPNP